ncbi:MAG: hypothetical protein JF615_10730 [Asticcacaulis sp.]|nr:hypothetical protein [Asticcacaulis sp.]
MGDIKVGSTPSFESVRTTLEEAYRKDKAAGKLNEVTNAFSDAINKGENFEATAAKLGLKIEPLLPMSSDGHATDPQTGRPVDYSAYGPLVNAVFSLPQPGSTSDVERMSDTEFFAVKLVNLKPAGAPPLAQVREQMAAAWQAQKLGDALKAKATEAQDRLNKGEALAAVAASYGAPIMPIKGLTLQAAQQRMRGELPGLIFNSKVNDSFQAAIAPGAIAVGRLEAVHQVSAADANNQSLMVSNQVSGSVAQDLMELTTRNVRKVTKTKTNVNAALRVLNVEPPAADDAKGDKAGKKKS